MQTREKRTKRKRRKGICYSHAHKILLLSPFTLVTSDWQKDRAPILKIGQSEYALVFAEKPWGETL